MDEFDTDFTINELISKENIEIITIHLLSEKDKFTLAVRWFEYGETHFKMFKKQNISGIKYFGDFLLEYDKNWYNLFINWITKPLLPPLPKS
jgi:hypothetical protein